MGTPPNKLQKQRDIPPFLRKLYHMVDDPSTNNSIRWLDTNDGFLLVNAEVFAKDVLPLYFKHNNFATFVRQLNMYDFSKIGHVEKGIVHIGEFHSWQFTHPYFRRGHPELLANIHRKTYAPTADKKVKSEHTVDELARQFDELRTENNDMRETINLLKEESQELRAQNQLLLQNSQMAMSKAHDLQVTIERIIQFLASVYSPEFIRQQLQQQPMLANMANNPAFAQYGGGPLSIANATGVQSVSNASAGTMRSETPMGTEPMQTEPVKLSDLQLVPTTQLYSHPNLDYLKALADVPVFSANSLSGFPLGTLSNAIPLGPVPTPAPNPTLLQATPTVSLTTVPDAPAPQFNWTHNNNPVSTNSSTLGPEFLDISSPVELPDGIELPSTDQVMGEGHAGLPGTDEVLQFLKNDFHDALDDNPRELKKERLSP